MISARISILIVGVAFLSPRLASKLKHYSRSVGSTCVKLCQGGSSPCKLGPLMLPDVILMFFHMLRIQSFNRNSHQTKTQFLRMWYTPFLNKSILAFYSSQEFHRTLGPVPTAGVAHPSLERLCRERASRTRNLGQRIDLMNSRPG